MRIQVNVLADRASLPCNGFNLQVPNPTGVAVDKAGNVYTADRTGLVRKLVPPTK